MRTSLFITGFLLLRMLPGFAQSDTLAHSLLWKIEGNGLTKPSYLYGTIHMIPVKDFFLPEQAVIAFAQCKILTTENSSITPYVSPENLAKIVTEYWLPDRQRVSDQMNPEDYSLVRDYMRRYGYYSKKYLRLKPIYLAGAIASGRFAPATGYEDFFWNWAKTRNQGRRPEKYMVIAGLEEFKTTFRYLDTLDRHYQQVMIKELTDEIKEDFAKYQTNVRNYQQQNIELLQRISARDSSHTMLVVTRNVSWLERIAKFMHSQPTFIAVGGAHLAGKYGLIALLRGLGYTVTPVLSEKVYDHAKSNNFRNLW